MNICVYGASSNSVAKLYVSATEKLGSKMAEHGHSLIFGGGAGGLMGAAARGVSSKGGNIVGIAPSFFKVDGMLYNKCTSFIYTETMRERKGKMEEMSDAFIAVPGGVGTFDELFEIITLKQLGRHNKPIAVFNINGYYDNMRNMLETAVSRQFMTDKSLKLCAFLDNDDKLLSYIENYSGDLKSLSDYKNV